MNEESMDYEPIISCATMRSYGLKFGQKRLVKSYPQSPTIGHPKRNRSKSKAAKLARRKNR